MATIQQVNYRGNGLRLSPERLGGWSLRAAQSYFPVREWAGGGRLVEVERSAGARLPGARQTRELRVEPRLCKLSDSRTEPMFNVQLS